MSIVKFQLVFNGQIDPDFNIAEIAPVFGSLLDIDPSLAGTYFTGQRVVLLDNSDFKSAHIMQQSMEAIGITADIKPMPQSETIKKKEESTQALQELTAGFSYKSSFKTDFDTKNPMDAKEKEEKDSGVIDPFEKEDTEWKIVHRPQDDDENDVDAPVDAADLYNAGFKDYEPEEKPKKDITESIKWKG